MIVQPVSPSRFLSALVVAIAMAAFFTPPAAAQNASNLNCRGCVDSKDLKENAVKTNRIKNKAVTEKKLSNALKDRLDNAQRPMLVDSTGKDIGPYVGRSRVIMASNVDGTLFT